MSDQHNWPEMEAHLEALRSKALEMGGPERIEREHSKGKYTVRERVERFIDPGTFDEWGILAHHQETTDDMVHRETPADGLVCGFGKVDGRTILLAADDGTVMGGSRGIVAEKKLGYLRRVAIETGIPAVFLQEASGGRVQELMSGFAGRSFGKGFRDLSMGMSGWVPVVSALMGAGFGQPAFVSGLADFSVMVASGSVGASGPAVVRAAIGESVSDVELGGAEVATNNGIVDTVPATEDELFEQIRRYLRFMPSNSGERPAVFPTVDSPDRRVEELNEIVPTNLRRAYDMRSVIEAVFDSDTEFLEMRQAYGPSLITGLARIDGHTVAVVASQPNVTAGVITTDAADKASRFISLADAFHIPIIFLVDTPGFMVGKDAERSGLAGAASRLLAAIYGATVPKITLILRKSYGLGWFAMNGRPMEPDLLLAWPTASIAQMGPEAAVSIVAAKKIAAADDPDSVRTELLEELREGIDPYGEAASSSVDDIISPAETRAVLASRVPLMANRNRTATAFKHRVPSR